MKLEDQFHDAMIAGYEKTGKETGYWGRYFLRAVKKNGGLATAKRMLQKRLRHLADQKGFRALVEAGRPDLSLESIVLEPQFRSLFTEQELKEAERRLMMVPKYARRTTVPPDDVYPDEIPENREYAEGGKKRIAVNAYERDPRARAACLKRHGYNCQVCGMNFEQTYGKVGKRFIHVHHKKPLAARRSDYRVNATKDLAPVCPNCHAVLHTAAPPLGIEELKEIMANQRFERTQLRLGVQP